MGENMKNMLIVDGHSDYLEASLDKNIHINNNLMFNIEDAFNNRPYIQLSSIFIHTKYIENGSGYKRAVNMLDKFEKEYEMFKEEYKLENITNLNSLNKVTTQNKIGILLTIENLGLIGSQISKINEFYDKGVLVMSLTWNDQNLIASGAKTINDTGITEFGFKCIDEINKVGIIIDVSHLSKNSFKDLMKINQRKIIATHSCVRNLCDNTRNLDDYEIKYISDCGGIIGINFYNKFLTDKRPYVTIDDIIDHITYIANLVGINHIGIGSDFDGLDKNDLPIGIKGVKDMYNLIDRLLTRGFSNYEIEKVMGKNIYDYFYNNLKKNILFS